MTVTTVKNAFLFLLAKPTNTKTRLFKEKKMKKKTFEVGDVVKSTRSHEGHLKGTIVGLQLNNPYGVDNPCAIVDVKGTNWTLPFWMLTKVK